MIDRFTGDHAFARPNDIRGLSLMNACAEACMVEFKDIVLAYGQSDEYRYVSIVLDTLSSLDVNFAILLVFESCNIC